MEDEKIIALYWQRDQSAIDETDRKYGVQLRGLSYGILSVDPAHRAFFHSAVRAEAFEVMFADKKFRRLSHRFHIQLLPAGLRLSEVSRQ